MASGPRFQSMQIEEGRTRIKFSDLESGLQIKDKYGYGCGFEIAGADGDSFRAQSRRDGSDILFL